MGTIAKEHGMLFDKRVDCFSIMTEMSVGSYLELVEKAYDNKGGIVFQREMLKTTTAKRIRSRMVEDIIQGTILPPLVIGVVVDKELFDRIEVSGKDIVEEIIHQPSASIIDGMQRTTALKEAVTSKSSVAKHLVRVECWVAESTESLIYRMLVLNTGQVPWSLKRQLQVVYYPLVDSIKAKVRIERLFTVDNPGKRVKGGEYAADDLVETYIAFGLRKTDIDPQETLAEEFSRLDVVDAISKRKYENFFYACLQLMVDIDKAFSRYMLDDNEDDNKKLTKDRFHKGRNIFDSQPARIGFMVSTAIYVLGRVGMDKDEEKSKDALDAIFNTCRNFTDRINEMTIEELGNFLALDVLTDMVPRNTTKVGRHERAFFEAAFRVLLIEDFAVPSMETCWRS